MDKANAQLDHAAEIESLNALLENRMEEIRAMNEALILSGVRQLELTETAELLNARLHRAMQESHHRIKNNLQVISALVEMQISETGTTACDEQLKRINRHLRALGSIHDLLTQQVKNNAHADYLGTQTMLERLISMLQEASGGRFITSNIANILLPTEKAASLSLLVSECVSNAVKHSKGQIEITLRVEGDKVHLEICDDGQGFAPDFDRRKAANTGLSLIDSTARYDLRGEVRYENQSKGGGRVAITFPNPDINKKSSDDGRQQ